MIKALTYIQKNLVWTIPVAMVFGVVMRHPDKSPERYDIVDD